MSFEDRKASPFAMYAKMLMLGKGSTREALNMAVNRRVIPNVVDALKSAVEAGTTVAADWAGSVAPYQTISQAFLESMGNSLTKSFRPADSKLFPLERESRWYRRPPLDIW